MSSGDKDWTGWGLDVFRLWRRRGGSYAMGFIFFGIFTQFVENTPAYVPVGLMLAGIGLAAYAYLKVDAFVRAGVSGLPVTGKVTLVEDRARSRGAEQGKVYERCVHYRYSVDGQDYIGRSVWEPKRLLEDIEDGSDVALRVNRKTPEISYLARLIPSTDHKTR